MSKRYIILLLSSLVIMGAFLMPASAQTVVSSSTNAPNITFGQANITYPTISGKIAFDPNNLDNLSVTDLTIYATNWTGFSTTANPAADGTFSMKVSGNGTYSFRVYPSELHYVNRTNNQTYTLQYPDGAARKYTLAVPDAGLNNITINTTYLETGLPTTVPPKPTPTATAKPTPGFTLVALLMAFAAVSAIVAYKKR